MGLEGLRGAEEVERFLRTFARVSRTYLAPLPESSVS